MTDTMSVSEAVDKRMSVRGFLPKPVSYETVREILDIARRAPSGGNVQPWEVHVLAGDALDALKAEVAEKIKGGQREGNQYDIYPPKLWEPHRSYRFKCGEDLYALIDVARDDKMGRLMQYAENYKCFGAPVEMFFSLNRNFGPPQWSDMGMLMQTIMLLAVERGLDTCPQESWSDFPDTVAKHCGLADDVILFSGMALGYRDPDHPLNSLRTDRAGVDDFVTFKGFE